ncbi:hypothetical protein CWO36_09825 [Vibrio splendidus]|uniref:Uncharacterized protein n=1 Tax=Vibrio splendidus TaxID=29497 RepID=A0A2T5EI27_VIBSP|nr:hypothetical protein CWO36_09825 [Vibrio splendidus]
MKYLGYQYSKSRITSTTDVKNLNLSTEASIVVNKERFGTEALPVAWRSISLQATSPRPSGPNYLNSRCKKAPSFLTRTAS